MAIPPIVPLVLRALQFLFGIITLGLTAYGMYSFPVHSSILLFPCKRSPPGVLSTTPITQKPFFFFFFFSSTTSENILTTTKPKLTKTPPFPIHLVVSWYNTHTNVRPPQKSSFLLFASIFTLFSLLAYLIPITTLPSLRTRFSHHHPYATAALDALNALFWFAGFVAMASFLASLSLCLGSICHALRAAACFAAFEWVLFMGTAVLSGMGAWDVRRGVGMGMGREGGVKEVSVEGGA